VGSSKQGRGGKAAKAGIGASPENLRRAEAKIRTAFGLLEGPELEKLGLRREGGGVVPDLVVRHKVDAGRGPGGAETSVTVGNSFGVHRDGLLAMDEAALARGFERQTSTGGLAPDLSGHWIVEEMMAMLEAAPSAS
jgi:hypothetical protein